MFNKETEYALRGLIYIKLQNLKNRRPGTCLLYTSDAADERSSVDLGGRRIIKKKNSEDQRGRRIYN